MLIFNYSPEGDAISDYVAENEVELSIATYLTNYKGTGRNMYRHYSTTNVIEWMRVALKENKLPAEEFELHVYSESFRDKDITPPGIMHLSLQQWIKFEGPILKIF
jgi:hypothetical protein